MEQFQPNGFFRDPSPPTSAATRPCRDRPGSPAVAPAGVPRRHDCRCTACRRPYSPRDPLACSGAPRTPSRYHDSAGMTLHGNDLTSCDPVLVLRSNLELLDRTPDGRVSVGRLHLADVARDLTNLCDLPVRNGLGFAGRRDTTQLQFGRPQARICVCVTKSQAGSAASAVGGASRRGSCGGE